MRIRTAPHALARRIGPRRGPDMKTKWTLSYDGKLRRIREPDASRGGRNPAIAPDLAMLSWRLLKVKIPSTVVIPRRTTVDGSCRSHVIRRVCRCGATRY